MSQIDEIFLWNRRMGHLKFGNLVKISKKGAIRNIPKIIKPPNNVCRHCLHGKQTRTCFKFKEHIILLFNDDLGVLYQNPVAIM